MTFYYYMDKDGVRQGPLPLQDISASDITPNTLVWCKGMKSWKKAREVSEFADLLSSATSTETPQTETSANAPRTEPPAVPPVQPQNTTENASPEEPESDESDDYEDEAEERKKKIMIGAGIAIAVIILFGIIMCGYNKSKSNNSALDSLAMDSIGMTSEEDEMTIKTFITDMYDNGLYEDYDFLRAHCTPHLLNKLEEDYDYDHTGEAYAVWDFRSGAQEEKENNSIRNHVISVESSGDGWFTYEFYDMGWRGKNRIKAYVEDGEVMMDAIEKVEDETFSVSASDFDAVWELTGTMSDDDGEYPIMLTFHQSEDVLYDCEIVFVHVNQGGKIRLTGSVSTDGFVFHGQNGSNDLSIDISNDYDQGGWSGTLVDGEDYYKVHLEE